MPQFVSISKKDSIGLISLNRPPANTYNLEFVQEFSNAIDECRFNDEIKGVILTSSLKMFSGGADIQMLKTSTPEYKAAFCIFCQETLNKMERLPKIVIAAINGHCVGGGLEIALACDFRFMAKGDFKIGLPEIKLGVLPGTGGTQRLPRLIGKARALDMMITGELLGPEEALNIGLVQKVFPPEQLMDKTIGYLSGLTKGPTRAIGLIKLSVLNGLETSIDQGLCIERELQNRLFVTEDAHEGLAAFLEKREAKFKGR